MIGGRLVTPALRSALAPWTLAASAAAARQPAFLASVNAAAAAAAPLRLAIAREPLEPLALSFARLRLLEGDAPVAMELLNRNARRPKKANHGKRPCSHHRRRQKRLSRRRTA